MTTDTILVVGAVVLAALAVVLLVRGILVSTIGNLVSRVERVEQDAREGREAVTRMQAEIAQAGALVQAMHSSAEAVRQEVQETAKGLASLRQLAEDQVRTDARNAEALRRLEALSQNVVLVSYSGLVPYLLLIVQTVLRSGVQIDVAKLSSAIDQVREALTAVEEELDGRFSRALTMLQNMRDETRQRLRKATTALSTVATRTALPENEQPELPE
jgi:predicted  nucleic acid-binding Zn-ribbon protein